MGFRKGDNAPLALVTLTERVDAEAEAPKPEAKKKAKKAEEKKAA
jgi:hypothetical protein